MELIRALILSFLALTACKNTDYPEMKQVDKHILQDMKHWDYNFGIDYIHHSSDTLLVIINSLCEEPELELYKNKVGDTLYLYPHYECDSYPDSKDDMSHIRKFYFKKTDSLSVIKVITPYDEQVYPDTARWFP